MAEEIKIKATLVLEISCKSRWINMFPGALPELPMTEKYIWIDAKGNSATCGEDFATAEDNDTYPIKVYLIERISHTKKDGYIEKLLKHIGV
jgi:hypothetical protein